VGLGLVGDTYVGMPLTVFAEVNVAQ